MPTQDRVRRKQRADLAEHFASEDLAFDSQSSALVVVEQDSLFAEFLSQHLVFGAEILDRSLLLLVDPASENQEEELPRLENETHVGPRW